MVWREKRWWDEAWQTWMLGLVAKVKVGEALEHQAFEYGAAAPQLSFLCPQPDFSAREGHRGGLCWACEPQIWRWQMKLGLIRSKRMVVNEKVFPSR